MQRLNQTNNFLKIKDRDLSSLSRIPRFLAPFGERESLRSSFHKILWVFWAEDSTLKTENRFLPLSKDQVGYIIHVFQSLLSNHRNSYFWQMWLTQPIGLLPSFQKMMETLRNIYWRHHVRFHHFDEVYIIQHERNALNIWVSHKFYKKLWFQRIFNKGLYS